MSVTRIFALSVLSLALVACAGSRSQTGYQNSENFGVQRGYSDEQLSENSHKINVLANSRTDRARVHDIALYRAAELTLEQGRTHFVIVESKPMVRTTTATQSGVPVWSYDEPVYEMVIEIYTGAEIEADPALRGQRPAEAAQVIQDIGPRLGR